MRRRQSKPLASAGTRRRDYASAPAVCGADESTGPLRIVSLPGASLALVEAELWSLIGILGGVLAVLLAFLFTAVRGLDGRIDTLGGRFETRVDALGDRFERLAVELRAEIRSLAARMDAHVREHRSP